MGIMKHAGFTIIETMLFLAVGGLLTIAIMATAGASIGAQRYKDAAATLQSDIQQLYEDTTSIKNERDDASTIPDPACSTARGQAECILMGKLMTIASNGAIRKYVVYGKKPTGAVSSSESAAIRAYNPTIVPGSEQASNMEWGTGLVAATGATSTPSSLGILVIRSPQTGLTFTFTRSGTSTSNLGGSVASPMVTTPTVTNLRNQVKRTVCINTTGWLTGDKMAVTIAANASSANAVEVRTNRMMSGEGITC